MHHHHHLSLIYRFVIIVICIILFSTTQIYALLRSYNSKSIKINMSNNEHISLSQIIIHKNHNDDERYPQSSTSLLASSLSSSAIDDEATRSSSSLSSSTGFKDIAAKIIGYIMGIGSMLLYSPIIITLLQTKNSDGFSISTWVFNVFGTMLAISYPVKRKFPISTYVELITVLLQGIDKH